LDEQHKSEDSYEYGRPRPRHHLASFGASIAAHVAIVGMLVMFISPAIRPHSEWVLAYLVEVGEGGPAVGGARSAQSTVGSDAGGGAAALTRPPSPPQKHAAHRPRRHHDDAAPALAALAPRRTVASPRPPDADADAVAAASAAATAANPAPAGPASLGFADRGGPGTAGTAAGASGTGGGSSGIAAMGDSVAHADYARNPPPIYPASARRRAQQGTVTVRVLVGADGAVEHAELAESSGFAALDNAALVTVRSRWVFIPARRDGVAVESWVLVPIRFALVEANASR
jgi:periplasmic protein TonB